MRLDSKLQRQWRTHQYEEPDGELYAQSEFVGYVVVVRMATRRWYTTHANDKGRICYGKDIGTTDASIPDIECPMDWLHVSESC